MFTRTAIALPRSHSDKRLTSNGLWDLASVDPRGMRLAPLPGVY